MNGDSYKNASMGMRHFFRSEILQIISVIFLLIAAVLVLTGQAAEELANTDAALEAAVPGIVIAALVVFLICSIFSLVSFILKLVGLRMAGRDHIYFKYAFGLVFIGILLVIGSSIFVSNELVSNIFSTAAECVDVVIMILVVYGCVALLNQKGNAELVYSGYSVLNLMIFVNIVSVIARIMPVFVSNDVWDLIFVIFFVVLSLVSGIMFLVFLKRASKALA